MADTKHLRRDDGTVFPHSDVLARHKDMRTISDTEYRALKAGVPAKEVLPHLPEPSEAEEVPNEPHPELLDTVPDEAADLAGMSRAELRQYALSQFEYKFGGNATKAQMRDEITERLRPASASVENAALTEGGGPAGD